MKIVSAEFLVSAVSDSQFPSNYLPEVAFLGKSNVGKSSLINSLVNRKGLVKTSGTPGKTRQINFFLINGNFRFVDLPGYGFSRVPRAERASWQKLGEGYLRERSCLRGVVMIVDARHPTSPLDMEMKNWLDHFGVPTIIVANKADKLSKRALRGNVDALGGDLCPDSEPLAHSAKSHLGRDGLWRLLLPWLTPTARARGPMP